MYSVVEKNLPVFKVLLWQCCFSYTSHSFGHYPRIIMTIDEKREKLLWKLRAWMSWKLKFQLSFKLNWIYVVIELPFGLKSKIRKNCAQFFIFFSRVLESRYSLRGKNWAYIVKNFVIYEEAASANLRNFRSSSERRILKRGGLELQKNWEKQRSECPIFRPKFRWRAKKKEKRSSHIFPPILSPNVSQAYRRNAQNILLVWSNFMPNLQRGRRGMPQFFILFYAIIQFWRPKRGGHGTMPPP